MKDLLDVAARVGADALLLPKVASARASDASDAAGTASKVRQMPPSTAVSGRARTLATTGTTGGRTSTALRSTAPDPGGTGTGCPGVPIQLPRRFQ